MIKLNIGAGGDIKEGWRNMDIMFAPPDYIDITEPLPFGNDSVDFIYTSHTVEHVTTPDAVFFFSEAYRVLKTGGTIRIAVPSVDKIFDLADEPYLKWHGQSGFGDGTKRGAVRSILLDHGHLSAWNYPILDACLYAAGFDEQKIVGCDFSELEGHGKVIGDHNNKIETIIMEAIK